MSIAPLLFYRGYAQPDKFEPLDLGFKEKVTDQDMYAIATGDEEYLAAHCTLSPLDEIEQEKIDIQKLKNKVARMKLEQELAKLQATNEEPAKVNPLITECIDALVSLGEKKSVARAKVNKFFVDNPNVNTVDQFITGVFK
tara:strand:+ start:1705 stop:2127 length:423 start_codon:yes stop_codon:yes gene_type:complete